VRLPTVVEGLQRRKQSKRRPEMTGQTPSDEKVSMEFQMFSEIFVQEISYPHFVQTGPLYRDIWGGYFLNNFPKVLGSL